MKRILLKIEYSLNVRLKDSKSIIAYFYIKVPFSFLCCIASARKDSSIKRVNISLNVKEPREERSAPRSHHRGASYNSIYERQKEWAEKVRQK